MMTDQLKYHLERQEDMEACCQLLSHILEVLYRKDMGPTQRHIQIIMEKLLQTVNQTIISLGTDCKCLVTVFFFSMSLCIPKASQFVGTVGTVLCQALYPSKSPSTYLSRLLLHCSHEHIFCSSKRAHLCSPPHSVYIHTPIAYPFVQQMFTKTNQNARQCDQVS